MGRGIWWTDCFQEFQWLKLGMGKATGRYFRDMNIEEWSGERKNGNCTGKQKWGSERKKREIKR